MANETAPVDKMSSARNDDDCHLTLAFAAEVTSKVLGCSVDNVYAAIDSTTAVKFDQSSVGRFDPTTIIAMVQAIIEAIMQLIDNCPNSERVSGRRVLGRRLFDRVQWNRRINDCCARSSLPRLRSLRQQIADEAFKLSQAKQEAQLDGILAECA